MIESRYIFPENRNHIQRVAKIKLSTLTYHSSVVEEWSILALIGILVRRKVGRSISDIKLYH